MCLLIRGLCRGALCYGSCQSCQGRDSAGQPGVGCSNQLGQQAVLETFSLYEARDVPAMSFKAELKLSLRLQRKTQQSLPEQAGES